MPSYHLYQCDKDATEALEDETIWNGHQGHNTRSAFKRELEAWADL